jgi:hypothetical protein
MNELDSRITRHDQWENWMINWIFQEAKHVVGYAPDNEILTTGRVTDMDDFFSRFRMDAALWAEDNGG